MGACLCRYLDFFSPAHILSNDVVTGDEYAYHEKYLEEKVLGEGQFGVVKMIREISDETNNVSVDDYTFLACKTLKKGVTFRDNTLYTPIKPQILRGEVEILQLLAGEHFCLKLIDCYETPRELRLVTDLCAGGEMMEWIAAQEEDLRTEDVSRIALQLLSAVAHCAAQNVIHRDIKPENVMFRSPAPKAELRLIDFGSGCFTDRSSVGKDVNEEGVHTTYAGTAFYNSPEMFQHKYTEKTDIWSVGVTLYVLVAGYPAADLQCAFNTLQKNRNRDLRKLTGMQEIMMPDSYIDMLDKLLVYRYGKRPNAAEMKEHEFVNNVSLAQEAAEGISLEAVSAHAAGKADKDTTNIMSIRGSVQKHSRFVGFKRFERQLSVLLAATLTKEGFQKVMRRLDASVAMQKVEQKLEQLEHPSEQSQQNLEIVTVATLRAILRDNIKNETA